MTPSPDEDPGGCLLLAIGLATFAVIALVLVCVSFLLD